MSSDGDSRTSQPSASTPREAFHRVKRSPELSAPEEVQMRMTPIAVAGTLLWALALIGTQVFADRLAESGNEWWAACALSGVILGLMGTAVMVVMDRRHFGRRSGRAPQSTSEPSSS